MKRSSVAERQRGRAFKLKQLDEAAAREKAEQRQKLQRRVERRALEHKVLLETIQLEKELEARRCRLCDLLRAEAWGLGHANWTERKCSRCWLQHADELARQRHSVPATARSGSSTRRAQSRPIAGTPEPRRLDPPSRDRPLSAARTAADGGSGDGVRKGEGDRGGLTTSLEDLFGGVTPDRVDDLMAALRARDAGRLVQLLDESALARHFHLQGGPSGSSPPATAHQRDVHLAPPPDSPYDGCYYYHDAVLRQLDAATSSATAGAGPDMGPSPAGGRTRGHHTAKDAAEAAGSETNDDDDDDDGDGMEASQLISPLTRQRKEEVTQRQPSATQLLAAGAAAEGGGLGGSGSVLEESQVSAPASELSFALGGRGVVEEYTTAAQRPEERVHGSESARGRGVAVKVAGYRPELRPLPSKPRRVPVDEAELEEALREAERVVVFGGTQRHRSEALFYSHQLRTALADLRMLRRKARKAEAVHRHGLRLDTRDEAGVHRIIREGRREEFPSPTTLRRLTQPDSFYTDPPRRAPRWLDHIHPKKPDPARAIDPVAWRPPSARPPPPHHTPGLQSAGDWMEYRYDWDLARIRSMKVEDYRSVLRRERAFRSAWAEMQVLSGLERPGKQEHGAQDATNASDGIHLPAA
ncbi:hypothetical protein VOLCADRAFT_115981 [Volvox carteri f. nagariensis]|uniref:Uncharacterized protein n=1 Tax=Volvox carteri f. nagariensis TaxID=3068 RepID=D8TJ99_VOLCA|nr:uncharacterized protein VOLCADRAFT_115981 [Volvox carteri f. nagariensis]EFJ52503.1 hypothetical protein VOLCADRAFT_115981 [Volvox carteri f. nagariensis]|eukprot:XP_002946576.1 hypothetical protein VOLCADRAFT_115981 [Volvox carteri f. nagariensis]